MADKKSPADIPSEDRLQGEGNYTATRAYDRDQKKFAESGKVESAAREAAESLDQDKADLDKAEAEGRKHSHGEDPALKREKRPGGGAA